MLNSFQSPGEVAFYIFGMPVYFYGIIMAIAIFVGFCVADYLYNKLYSTSLRANEVSVAIRKDNDWIASSHSLLAMTGKNLILNISPWLIISGIIGARLYYCLVNYSYYIQKPLEIFFIRQGGLSIHGAIIAGALTLFIFSKRYKIPFLRLTDIFLCGTILAQSIGRWGNFFNSEAFGLPCDLPWKLYIPISHRPLEYINFEYFHPTFLYESLLDLGIFVVLIIAAKRLSSQVAMELEGKKVRGLEDKLFNESSPSENIKAQQHDNGLPSYLPPLQPSYNVSLSEISQTQQPDNNLSSYHPTLQSSGLITSLYLILYAIARIFVEHFRIDSALNIAGIPIAQMVSFFMFITGTVLLIKILKIDKN